MMMVFSVWFVLCGCLQDVDWPCIGNDRGAQRYSSLDQIHQGNVHQLGVAWTYHTGELDENGNGKTIECTPLIIEGVMYITTGRSHVVALNASTGEVQWKFDPWEDVARTEPLASGGVNRGLAYWSDRVPGGERRIFLGTTDGRLYSLDPQTGRPDPSFGNGFFKDLREDLNRDVSGLGYGPTSAPAICRDVVILGFSCGEGPGVAAPGDVRAFDVRSGKPLWRFHTIPRPGEFGHETWPEESWKNRGGANAWGGLSVDESRNRVFFGTGSAAFDFYGGDRPGDNLFANATVCLDASNGNRVWHFQTVHHDLWDHDTPTYPNLIQVTHRGRKIDAVAQPTKTGFVFLFDRDTGKPLFEVVEHSVPASDVEGETASPTQPAPIKPPPFTRVRYTADEIPDWAEGKREEIEKRLSSLRWGDYGLPPSLEGTVVLPGFHGGATWSGASYDPESGLLYVNSNNIPNVLQVRSTEGKAPYPYTHGGYNYFRDSEGYPAIDPPWGMLTALDLNRGAIAWQVPLGEHPELTKRGVPKTGTENFGGTIVTAGGLVFIGGTKDEVFHAFDASTGALLWKAPLPAGGYATPSTYAVNGRQFVVIAAGGAGKPRTKAGDAFVAFALSRD